MADTADTSTWSQKFDRVTTPLAGWGALITGILGLHRWVAVGNIDWWSRAGLIVSLGLGVYWAWYYWPDIVARFRAWKRAGGANTTVIAIALIGCLILVNSLARRRLPLKWDLTKNQRFTLAPRSREILKSLGSPIKATVFIPAGRSTARARDLFKQYGEASDKFQWKRVDPLVDQTALLSYNPPPKLNPTNFTGAVLEYNGKRQDVTEFTEKEVTSAILKLTRDTQRKLLFLKGHGEAEIAAAGNPGETVQLVVEDLKGLQWPVETVDLYQKDAKTPDPAEVAVLVIAGPRREFAAEEQKKITEYLNNGGDVLLLLDEQGPTFTDFLKEWGIKTGSDLVVGENQGGLLGVEADSNAHAAVRAARRVVFRPLRSVTAMSPAPAGITVTEILSSGPFSHVIPNYTNGGSVSLQGAKPGPVGIAALAEKSIGTGDAAKKGRLLVVGGAAWITDQWTSLPFFNAALGSGLVNYLGEEEALVAIPPKDENTEQAFLTPDQGRLLTLIHFWDFPLLALLLAIVVYLKRR